MFDNEFELKDDFDPKEVNKKLKEYYGRELDGRQRFKLEWAENLTEKRLGTFSEYTPSGLFLREKTEIREVPKYDWIQGRWILEKLVFHYRYADIMTDQKGSYECVWVFYDAKGRYLTPHWWAVDYVVKSLLNRNIVRSHIGNEQVARGEWNDKHEAWVKRAREILDDDPFHGKLDPRSGEGVSFSKPWLTEKGKTHDKEETNKLLIGASNG